MAVTWPVRVFLTMDQIVIGMDIKSNLIQIVVNFWKVFKQMEKIPFIFAPTSNI
jgi:hypothetical protein